METSNIVQHNQLTCVFRGKFTFADHDSWQQMVNMIQTGIKGVTFNFTDVTFVDSAALGMLLLARDEAEKIGLRIAIRGANGQPGKMFEVSRFNEMFDISNG